MTSRPLARITTVRSSLDAAASSTRQKPLKAAGPAAASFSSRQQSKPSSSQRASGSHESPPLSSSRRHPKTRKREPVLTAPDDPADDGFVEPLLDWQLEEIAEAFKLLEDSPVANIKGRASKATAAFRAPGSAVLRKKKKKKIPTSTTSSTSMIIPIIEDEDTSSMADRLSCEACETSDREHDEYYQLHLGARACDLAATQLQAVARGCLVRSLASREYLALSVAPTTDEPPRYVQLELLSVDQAAAQRGFIRLRFDVRALQ